MTAADRDKLKLRAREQSDFEVLSSVLQDSLLPVRDMGHLPKERRFVLLANRFRWEARAANADLPDQPRPDTQSEAAGDATFEDAPLYERIQCGVTFDRVSAVQFRGFNKNDPDTILNLLAVVSDNEGIILQCSGGAAIRLQGRRLVCHLEDLGEPWPTHWRPSHSPADDAETGDTEDQPSETDLDAKASAHSRSEDS